MVKIRNHKSQRGSKTTDRLWWWTGAKWLIGIIVICLIMVSMKLGTSGFDTINYYTTTSSTTITTKNNQQASDEITPTISKPTKSVDVTPTSEGPVSSTSSILQANKFKPPPPIAQAAKSIQGGKKLLTYGRFGGRLNNQLFQFVAALTHATILNRTLVFPPEDVMVRWTGFVDNDIIDLWDLTDLNANYDIDWTTAVTEELSIPDEEHCKLTPGQHFTLLYQKGIDKYQHCQILHMGGDGGLLFDRQNHRFPSGGKPEYERIAFDIYQRLHPSQPIQQMIAQFELAHPYKLAVHSRTHGSKPPYPHEICVNGNNRVCRPHLGGELQQLWCDNHTMHVDCAKWTEDLVGQLRNKQSVNDLMKQNSTRGQQPIQFVLANDMTHDYDIEFKGQYSIISNKEYMDEYRVRIATQYGNNVTRLANVANSPFAKENIKRGQKSFDKEVDRLSQIMMEVWSLIKPKYMLGNIYSTMSFTACIMRGEHRRYDSNMCWILMHPDSKLAIPPPV